MLKVSGFVISTPDPHTLAEFYHRLTGWRVKTDEPGWAKLASPYDEGLGISFHAEDNYVRPAWPTRPGEQLMQMHLDIGTDDLDAAGAHAVACGATLAGYQPQADVRVYLDPDGHPFCLFRMN